MEKVLVYRVLPDCGVVFARPDRAAFIAQIHDAIGRAKTWGEFAVAMPPEALEHVLQGFDEIEEPRPNPDEAFDPMQISGWADGDYPPWLQQEMEHILPHALLVRFGQRCTTVFNGAYWFIPEGSLIDMCDALAALGWQVTEAAGLDFY